MRKSILFIPLLVLAIAGILSSIFIVNEKEQALVLQFGRVVSVKKEPGIGFRIPMIQEVVRYDDRILSRDVPPREVTPSDDRILVVDAFARYQIVDPETFRQRVGAGDIPRGEQLLDGILLDEIRGVLGTVSSNDILSSDRAALMERISRSANTKVEGLGLRIVDVRLKRTELPKDNLTATYLRMIAERQREAADEIARGQEAALRITAQADRTVVEIESEAQRESEIIRGEADARRNAIFAEAYGADAEFFEFYRALEAYRTALRGENSTLVLSPDSDFFNYLESDIGAEAQSRGAE